MRLIEKPEEMRAWSTAERLENRRIALVPTMGFLHEGHLSLVREARRKGGRTVVSIFANPKQFGPTEDFSSYPRDFDRDWGLLQKENIDVLYHPSESDVYPSGYQTYVTVEELTRPLCGTYRPGHFRGVATVVVKLFNVVQPHVAVFGLKDYQQVQVIRRMVADLNLDIDIVACPTVREEDGLAMSSRNAYLSAEERQAALCLRRALLTAQELVRRGENSAERIREAVVREISREPLARLEYAEICDPDDLSPAPKVDGAALVGLCVWVGKTRLIDNILLV